MIFLLSICIVSLTFSFTSLLLALALDSTLLELAMLSPVLLFGTKATSTKVNTTYFSWFWKIPFVDSINTSNISIPTSYAQNVLAINYKIMFKQLIRIHLHSYIHLVVVLYTLLVFKLYCSMNVTVNGYQLLSSSEAHMLV